jgi:hypothetical protein
MTDGPVLRNTLEQSNLQGSLGGEETSEDKGVVRTVGSGNTGCEGLGPAWAAPVGSEESVAEVREGGGNAIFPREVWGPPCQSCVALGKREAVDAQLPPVGLVVCRDGPRSCGRKAAVGEKWHQKQKALSLGATRIPPREASREL